MSDVHGAVPSMRGAIDLTALGTPAPAPGEPGGAPAGGNYVVEVDLNNFQSVVERSGEYPVVFLLWMPQEQANAQVATDLGRAIDAMEGRALLARVDVEANPQIAASFQVQGVPSVVAVLAGQPVPLFAGVASEQQIREVLVQLLAAAEANGITGRAAASTAAAEVADGQPGAEPTPAPLPPLHQEAYEALERDDFDGAAAAFTKAIRQDPTDEDAAAGLAQVELLQRTVSLDLNAVRAAAADQPDAVAAQLQVADLDLAGGKVEDALDRLLELLPRISSEEKDQVRVRILDYFKILGPQDPRVAPARRRLANSLY